MGASRWMAVSDHHDEQTDRTFKAGEFVTGSDYERLGEPSAFKPADYPSEVDQLREEYGLDEPSEQSAAEGTQYDEEAELEARNVDELRKLAADRDIAGRSDMNKAQLIQALRED